MNKSQIREEYNNLIKIIKKIRVSKSYSQEYIGAKLQISQNSYSKLKLGHVELTVTKFIEIAKILEVDYNEILQEGFSIKSGDAISSGHHPALPS